MVLGKKVFIHSFSYLLYPGQGESKALSSNQSQDRDSHTMGGQSIETTRCTHIFTYSCISIVNLPTGIFLHSEKKPENPGEIHMVTAKICRTPHNNLSSGITLKTLKMWRGNASCYSQSILYLKIVNSSHFLWWYGGKNSTLTIQFIWKSLSLACIFL